MVGLLGGWVVEMVDDNGSLSDKASCGFIIDLSLYKVNDDSLVVCKVN